MTSDHNRLTINAITTGYGRVIIENPPINLYDPEMLAELDGLMDRIDADGDLKVIVFESANRDQFVAHSELALACDIRFASKEKAVLAQVEVGAAVVPGGGAIEWLTALAGRSRALEIICGADDFDADTAEKYGWVNRSIPDAELDAFVDDFARRVASFEKRALELAKKLVNARGGVPSEAERC